MTRFWPKSLTGQVIASLLLALAVAQAVSFAIFASERRHAVLSARREQVIERTASLVKMVEQAPGRSNDALSDAMLTAASSEQVRFWRGHESVVSRDDPMNHDNFLVGALRSALDRNGTGRTILVELREAQGLFRFRPHRVGQKWRRFWDDDDHEHEHGHEYEYAEQFHHRDHDGFPGGWRRAHPLSLAVSVMLKDGAWLNAEMAVSPPRGWAFPSIVAMVLMAAAICLVTVVVVRRSTRPLADLANAADALGRGDPVTPLPLQGSHEIRRTTAAFNRMQERLHRFINDRTAMLAAISHDLRTPLTSLRLRAEFITDDDENKRKILQTLDEMEKLTEATLAFAREDAGHGPLEISDIRGLLLGIAEEMRDLGNEVVVAPGEPASLSCRPMGLKRALRNLIENAVTYGARARVRIEPSTEEVAIYIDDDGPGIAESRQDEVFEPFVRLESSRNRDTGGVGLGLAIARSIVRGHGGDISLKNFPDKGLSVVVRLPRPVQPA